MANQLRYTAVLAFATLGLVAPALGGTSLPGQIIVDPDNGAWLVRNEDTNGDGEFDPMFISGAGDPWNAPEKLIRVL